jgi:hypothetical protein
VLHLHQVAAFAALVMKKASAPTALASGIWRPVVVLPAGAGTW